MDFVGIFTSIQLLLLVSAGKKSLSQPVPLPGKPTITINTPTGETSPLMISEVNDPFRLTCVRGEGAAIASWKWFKDGSLLSAGSGLTLTGPALERTSSLHADSGEYKCKAVTAEGVESTEYSEPVLLTVHVACRPTGECGKGCLAYQLEGSSALTQTCYTDSDQSRCTQANCCNHCYTEGCNDMKMCSSDPMLVSVDMTPKPLFLKFGDNTAITVTAKIKIDKETADGTGIAANSVNHFKLSLTPSDSDKIGGDTLNLPAVIVPLNFKDKILKGMDVTAAGETTINIPKEKCHEIHYIQFYLQRGDDPKVWYRDDDLGNNFFAKNIRAHLLCPPDLTITNVAFDDDTGFRDTDDSVVTPNITVKNSRPIGTIGTPIHEEGAGEGNFQFFYKITTNAIADLTNGDCDSVPHKLTVKPNQKTSILIDSTIDLEAEHTIPPAQVDCESKSMVFKLLKAMGGTYEEPEALMTNNCFFVDIEKFVQCKRTIVGNDLTLVNADFDKAALIHQGSDTNVSFEFVFTPSAVIRTVTNPRTNFAVKYIYSELVCPETSTCATGGQWKTLEIDPGLLRPNNIPANSNTLSANAVLERISASDCLVVQCIKFKIVAGTNPSHYELEADMSNNCWSVDVSTKKQCETDLQLSISSGFPGPTLMTLVQDVPRMITDVEFNIENMKTESEKGAEVRPVSTGDFGFHISYQFWNDHGCKGDGSASSGKTYDVDASFQDNTPDIIEINSQTLMTATLNVTIPKAKCESIFCMKFSLNKGPKAKFTETTADEANNYVYKEITVRCEADPAIEKLTLKPGHPDVRQDTNSKIEFVVDVKNKKAVGTAGTGIAAAPSDKYNFVLRFTVLSNAAKSGMTCSELKASNQLREVQMVTVPKSSQRQEALPSNATITIEATVQLTANSTECQGVKYLFVMLSRGDTDYIDADEENNCMTLDLSPVLKCSPGNCKNGTDPFEYLQYTPCNAKGNACVGFRHKDNTNKNDTFLCAPIGFCNKIMNATDTTGVCCCEECTTDRCLHNISTTRCMLDCASGGSSIGGRETAVSFAMVVFTLLAFIIK